MTTCVIESPLRGPSQHQRAIRRHHCARLRRVRRRYWGRDLALEPVQLAKAIQTPAICSCALCGNPARYHKGRTPVERRQRDRLRDGLMALHTESVT